MKYTTILCLFFLATLMASAENMPVLRITMSDAITQDMGYSNGFMQLTDVDGSVVELPAKFKTRGATARSYLMKPSLNMKLRTADYAEEADSSLLGMRSCSSWILDAMSIDKARMRNRISTDLWNDFSTASYIRAFEPTALNGTRGQFVEVFYNHRYQGVYCMTEKIDRKQLQLRKFMNGQMRGVLYKTNKWNTLVATSPVPTNTQSIWNGIEISYPNLEDGEPVI